MKKVLILACAALTACTNDIDLGPNKEQVETLSNAIGFQMAKKNMTTTKATETLQSQGHYNFGVWGYKAVTAPAVPTIMENYLVGFGDGSKGYKMDASTQTTWGNATASAANGKSQWAYERLGTLEYNNTDDRFYKRTDMRYMSNNDNQYLRYWDLSAATTNFYAYAPYINGTNTVTFDHANKKMTFPDGSIEAGYDNPTDNEYMYAATQVKSADYGKDVSLVFKRLNSKINIKFYEDIAGYDVQILNLSDTYNEGVYARPAKRSGTTGAYTYSAGKLMTKTGVSITFSGTEYTTASISDWKTTTSNQSTLSLKFTAPAAKIGTAKLEATPSTTTYYAIPKKEIASATGAAEELKNVGFTFHVTYKLISTTDEEITVKDATVFVPAENCEWECNKAYTYIFKITKNSNGSTGTGEVTNPDETEGVTPGEEAALYPIVFDGCTVDDYENVTATEHVITEGTFNYYLNLDKTTVSKTASDADRTITVSNAHKVNSSSVSTPAADGDIKVYFGATEASTSLVTVTHNSTANTFSIKVETGATTGEYTVKYCGVKVATFEVTNS